MKKYLTKQNLVAVLAGALLALPYPVYINAQRYSIQSQLLEGGCEDVTKQINENNDPDVWGAYGCGPVLVVIK